MSQRQINAAHVRSLKTTYKHLDPVQKRLVKAYEQIEICNLDLYRCEKHLKSKYGEFWRKNKDAQFESDYEVFYFCLLEIEKLNARINRIEEKYNLDRLEVIKFHRTVNSARCYGGSY